MKPKVLFCPDVAGPCIENDCVSYNDHMIIEINSANMFIYHAVNCKLDYNVPMVFSLKIGGCSKYEKATDNISGEILKDFKKELDLDKIFIEDTN